MAEDNLAYDFGSAMHGVMPQPVEEKAKAEPKSREEFDALAPGTQFLDPEGATRVKPYTPKSPGDYVQMPEGAEFLDPEGQLRKKPTYEGIDFTTQTLYDMAVTDKERRKALERNYPGKVKEGPDGLYIEDEGTYRKPGRGLSAYTGFAAAAAAPTVGSVFGALGGGALSGPAAVAGAAAGGAGGAFLGQTFNDLVLGLSGVYDRSVGEQAANMAVAGMAGAAGAGVGRGLATVVPSVKAGISAAGAAVPKAAAYFLGAGEAELKTARELAEQGVMVPPSSWAHEAPHLQNMVEVFDPAFRTNKPLRQSAVDYYEKEAGKTLEAFGVEKPPSVVEPTAEIPTRAAGERIMQRTLQEQAQADSALKSALEQRAEALRARLPEQQAQRETLQKAAEESRKAAQKLIDEGFKDIERDAADAFKVAKAGSYSGDLWEHVGNKLRAVRTGISERARYWYERYDEMTGGHKVSSDELAGSAKQMLDELPPEFKGRNPTLVQQLEKIGAQFDEEGALIKPAEELTYGQVHQLRSLFRGAADWHTLSSDFKNGALKRFSNEIDSLLHDPTAPVEVRNAGKFLDQIDKWYAHNIKIFNAQQIKAVMKGLEAGEPADAANLYNTVVKEGHTDLINRVKKMVGPNLWAGVEGADTRAMLDASKTLEPGVIDARKFAREVLERHRGNTLGAVHGAKAEKLLAQARAIEQLDGRLPMPATPNDTMTQVIQRARLAAEEAKTAATKDPLGTLNKEMRKIERQNTPEARQAALKRDRREDPLGFLYDPTTGASAAVDKILKSEDLILAAAARFGEASPEFNMLRQIYAQRVLVGTTQPGGRLAGISPEIQQLMFPGVTLKQMQLLAKNMDFLMERRGMSRTTAGSMSAMAKVEHPLGKIVSNIPVAKQLTEPVARAALGKFYALVTKIMTSPANLRRLEKGLSGTPEERAAVKFFTDKVMQKGGAVGAGAAESTYQGGLE